MGDEVRNQAEILAAIAGAREELTASLAGLRATVDQLNAQPLVTDEEKAALEEHQEDIALAFEDLIEAEEATGNFIFDEVPTSDS